MTGPDGVREERYVIETTFDVLVPTDGGERAKAAVGYAEDVAERYGATVYALRIVDACILENLRITTACGGKRVDTR